MKHRAVKIVLGGASERVVVRPSGASLWEAARSVLCGWEETITFEVHYDDGKVFVGHMVPTYGDTDVARCMRQFCEFYALRRLPTVLHNKESFRRFIRCSEQHKAAIEWLEHYEIGPRSQETTDSNITMASMTPSWTPA